MIYATKSSLVIFFIVSSILIQLRSATDEYHNHTTVLFTDIEEEDATGKPTAIERQIECTGVEDDIEEDDGIEEENKCKIILNHFYNSKKNQLLNADDGLANLCTFFFYHSHQEILEIFNTKSENLQNKTLKNLNKELVIRYASIQFQDLKLNISRNVHKCLKNIKTTLNTIKKPPNFCSDSYQKVQEKAIEIFPDQKETFTEEYIMKTCKNFIELLPIKNFNTASQIEIFTELYKNLNVEEVDDNYVMYFMKSDIPAKLFELYVNSFTKSFLEPFALIIVDLAKECSHSLFITFGKFCHETGKHIVQKNLRIVRHYARHENEKRINRKPIHREWIEMEQVDKKQENDVLGNGDEKSDNITIQKLSEKHEDRNTEKNLKTQLN